MDAEKDYYSILGVVPSIDDVALTAVYRALLKKYHPDVFKGSKAEAERRTKELNEAYEVLGNADKRRAYDNARKDSGFGNYRQEEPFVSPNDVIADWEVVKKYHPETEERRVLLSKLSRSLAFAFQVTVLEKKLGSNVHEIANIAANMATEFLERYFGKNQDIQRFARDALVGGRSDVAKEVNRAVKVLGTPPDNDTAHRFIKQVQDSMKYNPKCSGPTVSPGADFTFAGMVFLIAVAIVAGLALAIKLFQ
jgi:curved DNA-binding protein CbpA